MLSHQHFARVCIVSLGILAISTGATGQAETPGAAQPPTVSQETPEAKEAREAKERIKRWQWEFWNEGRPVHPPMKEAPSPDSPNAAARYLWLFERADDDLLTLANWLSFGKEFGIGENDEGYTTDQLRSSLIKNQPWIESLMQTARMDACDFGFSEAPIASHHPVDPRKLGPWRKAMWVLIADAKRLVSDGSGGAAVERLQTILRMSRHLLRGERNTMTGLVSASLQQHAAETATQIVDQLDDPSRHSMLRSLRELDPLDPAGHRARWSLAWRAETEFIRQNLQGDRVGMPLRKTLLQIQQGLAMIEGMFEQAKKGDTDITQGDLLRAMMERIDTMEFPPIEELRAKLERATELGEQLERAWDDPGGEAIFKTADDEIADDESQLLTLALVVPKGIFKDRARTVNAIRDAIAALEKPR